MPNITKPNDMNTVWASTGDVVAPDADYISNGWEAIIPPKEYFNWLDNRQDRFNAHVNQQGIPSWDSSTEYQANLSYSKGSNGIVYKALTTNSNVNPVGDTTGAWQQAFSLPGMQRFTSDGVFTVPAGKTTIYISATAGGGGGGGAGGNSNRLGGGGGGGAAGAFIIRQAYTVVPGQSINITVGSGGVRGVGAALDGTAGTAGGSTLVAGLVSLVGGAGGSGAIGSTGAGGLGASPGGQSGGDAQTPGTAGDGGNGGGGPYGTAGGGQRAGKAAGKVAAASAAAGFGTGGGGGGGSYTPSGTGLGGDGSDGRPGIVIIEWL